MVDRKYVVQIGADGTTIPAESIATPQQVEALSSDAATVYTAATNAQALAAAQADLVRLYSTNYVVTSTVYVQSIGGVPYDPSNQVVRIQSFTVTPTEITLLATLRQIPLTPPMLDWRMALNAGGWSNVAATVAEAEVPEGVTNAAAAYTFTVPRPAGGSGYVRIVDNSTGASGSGLYWLVFGGVWVDGKRGWTGTMTNIAGSVTNRYLVKGGLVVEPEPIGGL